MKNMSLCIPDGCEATIIYCENMTIVAFEKNEKFIIKRLKQLIREMENEKNNNRKC